MKNWEWPEDEDKINVWWDDYKAALGHLAEIRVCPFAFVWSSTLHFHHLGILVNGQLWIELRVVYKKSPDKCLIQYWCFMQSYQSYPNFWASELSSALDLHKLGPSNTCWMRSRFATAVLHNLTLLQSPSYTVSGTVALVIRSVINQILNVLLSSANNKSIYTRKSLEGFYEDCHQY